MHDLFSPQGLLSIQRLATRPSALIFDFDGTLAPIVPHRNDAKIPAQTAAHLMVLSRSWPVAVVTGRSVEDAQKRLGFTPDYLFGNHGSERAGHPALDTLDAGLNKCRTLLSEHALALTARKVSVEDKGLSLALHYRQCDDPVGTSIWLEELLQSIAKDTAVTGGHMVINVLPTRAADKGDALLTILQESSAETALVVGDDENDEAAFLKAPENALTVRIGLHGTCSHARFNLSGQHQISALLSILVRQKNQFCYAFDKKKYAALL